MPPLDLPFRTFADLAVLDMEVQVACQKCGHTRLIDNAAMGDRRLAGNRYRCTRIVRSKPCDGVGLPHIGKVGRWHLTTAEHARILRKRR